MKKQQVQTRVLIALLLISLGLPRLAAAIPIPTLYSSGVDGFGNLLPDGAIDSHYTLVVSPDATFPGPSTQVVNSAGWQYNYWTTNGPNSKWVAPRASADAGNAGGQYIYRTTFDLTGLNANTAVINGILGSDDEIYAITLNNNIFITQIALQFPHVGDLVASMMQPGVIVNASSPFLNTGFSATTPFTIDEGFIAGINSLEFLVNNGGGTPTGLRVELTGTAEPAAVPEPSTGILLGAGGICFCVIKRRLSKRSC